MSLISRLREALEPIASEYHGSDIERATLSLERLGGTMRPELGFGERIRYACQDIAGVSADANIASAFINAANNLEIATGNSISADLGQLATPIERMIYCLENSTISPFDPADILVTGWYDASDLSTITESAGRVSLWDDISGNGWHANQSTATLRPTSGGDINGLNAISWAGEIDDNELLTSLNQLTNVSIYYLFHAEPNGALSNNCIINASVTDWNDGGVFVNLENYNTDVNVHLVRYGGFSPTSYINGVLGAQDHGFVPAIGSHQGSGLPTANGQYLIGRVQRNNTNRWAYKGLIGEILICPEEHNADTRQKVEGYLAHKWFGSGALNTLPTNHMYKNYIPYSLT